MSRVGLTFMFPPEQKTMIKNYDTHISSACLIAYNHIEDQVDNWVLTMFKVTIKHIKQARYTWVKRILACTLTKILIITKHEQTY